VNNTLDGPDGEGHHRSTTTPAMPEHNPPTAVSAEVVAEFTAFYRAAAPRLMAFLIWQGAPFPDAADCVQEALTQAYRQWSTLHHPHAWCRLVASRRYARHLATVREHPVEDLDLPAGAPLLPSDVGIDDVEHRHTALALLTHLPPRQRQVMAWTYDGATPSEIAEALQISTEAVRSNLHKARTTLRGLTGEHR
jgi:RNA polymerase sigma factor (sigma-70 family)